MFTIRKEFAFSASHALRDLPESHPCSRVHGHNYVVTVELRSLALNKTGFVVDYRKLDVIKNFINETFDHQHLNDIVVYNPTAENLAADMYDIFHEMIPEVCAVEVSETPKTIARYTPEI